MKLKGEKMTNFIPKKYRIIIFFTFVFVVIISFILTFTNKSNIQLSKTAHESPSESFSFFSVGENTILTRSKLEKLRKILGQERLENITPVFLDFIHEGWLPSHFQAMKDKDAFFTKKHLIQPIASNTLKLYYRYARQYNVPFSDILFIFSAYDKKPLFLKLKLPGNAEIIKESLQRNHGNPESIQKDTTEGSFYLWQHQNDFLLTATLSDRFGKPETHIFIAYMDNLDRFMQQILLHHPEPGIRIGF